MLLKLYTSIIKLGKTDIFKVFSLNAISTFIKFITGFISVKVIAVLIGPSGIALLGQLNSFSSIIMSIATGGINNGVVKYVSEYSDTPSKVRIFISTAFSITITISFLCGLFLLIFANSLSNIILLNADYSYVFTCFGITIVFYSLNSLLFSIINGYKDFKKFVTIGILQSIVGLAISLSLVHFYGIKGALISAVTYQSIIFFIAIVLVYKAKWFSFKNFAFKINIGPLKKYLSYSIMALTTAATVPVSQLILRSHIITTLSVQEAGWWEAMNKLSGMYLMIITSSFGVYYLPKLSSAKNSVELKNEVYTAFKFITPLLVLGFTIIYFCKELIIQILFSEEFFPMSNLFIWQLMGDFFKMAAWLFAFTMISKSLTKMFVISEVFFSITYVLIAYTLVRSNGIIGITQAHLINYILYFIFTYIVFNKKIIN